MVNIYVSFTLQILYVCMYVYMQYIICIVVFEDKERDFILKVLK
jgi:hypothetical protein